MLGSVACHGFPRSALLGPSVLFGTECNISITKSQRLRAKTASRDMSSASIELCDTEVCFLHLQLIGTNV